MQNKDKIQKTRTKIVLFRKDAEGGGEAAGEGATEGGGAPGSRGSGQAAGRGGASPAGRARREAADQAGEAAGGAIIAEATAALLSLLFSSRKIQHILHGRSARQSQLCL